MCTYFMLSLAMGCSVRLPTLNFLYNGFSGYMRGSAHWDQSAESESSLGLVRTC